ncbi:hypothetical protein EMCRGX_G001064 [Ephydatia muelleri]
MDRKVATPLREKNRSCSPNSIRQVRGVVFDMDGTLTLPTLDFAEMKRQLKLPPSSDIWVSVQAMSGEDKEKSMVIIEEMLDEANRRLRLQPGVLDVLHFLAQRGLGKALLTWNSEKNVRVFVEHVKQLCASTAEKYPLFAQQPLFSQVITGEFQPCKPDPAPFLHVCEVWSMDPRDVVMVGDDRVDMMCGRGAGAVTVLLANEHNAVGHAEHADHIITSLHDLIPLLFETTV